jgi:hypothetical protein
MEEKIKKILLREFDKFLELSKTDVVMKPEWWANKCTDEIKTIFEKELRTVLNRELTKRGHEMISDNPQLQCFIGNEPVYIVVEKILKSLNWSMESERNEQNSYD